MSDNDYSHGPVSTLPGNTVPSDPVDRCDDCDKPSTHRVQGETDSFGCEYLFFCADCHGKFKLALDASRDDPGTCDFCKGTSEPVRTTRDPDEGSSGPVYHACTSCRAKRREQAWDELNDRGYDGDWMAEATDADDVSYSMRG